MNEDIKNKYLNNNLTLDDIIKLNDVDLEKLNQNNIYEHFLKSEINPNLLEAIGLINYVKLYKDNKEVYLYLNTLFNQDNEELRDLLKNRDIVEYKNICNDYLKRKIIIERDVIDINKYPVLFREENPDLFLNKSGVTEDIKNKYYHRSLTITDYLNNSLLFKDIILDNFFQENDLFNYIKENYPMGKLQKLILKYPVIFKYLELHENYYIIKDNFRYTGDLENDFCNAIKYYYIFVYAHFEKDIPSWLLTIKDFNFKDNITNQEDLMSINENTLVTNYNKQMIIDIFGLKNMQMLEQETKFFTYNMDIFTYLYVFFQNFYVDCLKKGIINFQEGKLEYLEFQDMLAKSLNIMRKNHLFSREFNYDFIKGNFRTNHPEIFIDPSFPKEIKDAFYDGLVAVELFFNNPDNVPYLLKGVKIEGCMLNENTGYLNLIDVIGYEKFYELCLKYGGFLNGLGIYLTEYKIDKNISMASLDKIFEDIITRQCLNGNIIYSDNNTPAFLPQKHPELFLSPDAPEELKRLYYAKNGDYLTFEKIKKHKEWQPFLKGKDIASAILKNNQLKEEFSYYFQLFGRDKGTKLGINKPETIREMVMFEKADLMKAWYEKTGNRFIPDFVVMLNFPLEEADKFLQAGSIWSRYMQIPDYSNSPEARDGILKLAYALGVFDHDPVGINMLHEILLAPPKVIKGEYKNILKYLDDNLFGIIFDYIQHTDQPSSIDGFVAYLKTKDFIPYYNKDNLIKLFKSMQKEMPDVKVSLSIKFHELFYRRNENWDYILKIDPQKCPKTSEALHMIFTGFVEMRLFNYFELHTLFSSFKLEYDPDFRKFFIDNLDKAFDDEDYGRLIGVIQHNFQEFKHLNSNRTLTWDLAKSFASQNRYWHVLPGNEKLASIASVGGYSQVDFDTLQEIYNHGKQRVYSSIPRVTNQVGNYHFEMLRLDDPLALAIGTLTDCCQEINNMAEACMEHSMVSEDGRIFVIYDNENNIVAQSWVWRNNDTICFDNIEIPDKVFSRARKVGKSREELAKEIYQVYVSGAESLIKKDEKTYTDLFQKGKITKEQYDGLRLRKVTVGLGYNDIADALKKNGVVDSNPKEPKKFVPPVNLRHRLYTNDSQIQYILAQKGNDENNYQGENLAVYNDLYPVYNHENFTKLELATFLKLFSVTKHTNLVLDDDTKLFVEQLAQIYSLDPLNTQIIIHPNFAIIYEIKDNTLIIGDILYNLEIENKKEKVDITEVVLSQISLAIEQISQANVDLSRLNDEQINLYEEIKKGGKRNGR